MTLAGVVAPVRAGSAGPVTADTGEFRLALRRLSHDPAAVTAAAVFVLIVLACAAAPLYAQHVAGSGPNVNHITETVVVGGQVTDVISPTGIPIGPTWQRRFFLGADSNGRDVAVRLLYGGRASLLVGFVATGTTVLFATTFGVLSGYHRGWVDGVLSRLLDVIWAYPVVLLGIALGTALTLGGLRVGPLVLSGNSLFVPALIIGFVYVPYMARPIRAQVLLLREKEFVSAAQLLGKRSTSVIFSEILPNVATTVLVFVPLMLANAVLLEAGLSYLGAGVQPPNASWGTMIASGVALLTSTPSLLLAPTLMLVLATVSLNVLGESLRGSVDPGAVRAAAR